jgi:hypothetical protein
MVIARGLKSGARASEEHFAQSTPAAMRCDQTHGARLNAQDTMHVGQTADLLREV